MTKARSNAVANAAKGDLTVGTGTNLSGILPVSPNSGDTIVADASQTSGLRYNPQNALANPIINGGFDNWQRGTSFSLTASTGTTYVSDRWATSTGANQACTISRQVTGDTTNLPNIQYALRLQRNSGQTGTSGMAISTSLETVNTIPFAGKTVTMSFYAKKGATYTPGTFNAYLITGTGTDQNRQSGGYTGENSSISAAISLTTTWQRFVVTGTIPATATEMAPYFFFDFAGTAGATDFFEITGFQIDLGTYTASSAPSFRRSGGTIQGELAACQRYYVRHTAGSSYTSYGAGLCRATTSVHAAIQHPVQLRVAPTSVDYSTIGVLNSTGGVVASTALVLDYAGTQNSFITVSVASGLTVGNATLVVANASTSAYIAFNAEL